MSVLAVLGSRGSASLRFKIGGYFRVALAVMGAQRLI